MLYYVYPLFNIVCYVSPLVFVFVPSCCESPSIFSRQRGQSLAAGMFSISGPARAPVAVCQYVNLFMRACTSNFSMPPGQQLKLFNGTGSVSQARQRFEIVHAALDTVPRRQRVATHFDKYIFHTRGYGRVDDLVEVDKTTFGNDAVVLQV